MDDPIQATAPGPQTIAEDTSITFSFLDPYALLVDGVIDQLYGEAGLDLFFTGFTSPADTANDFGGSEMKVGQ